MAVDPEQIQAIARATVDLYRDAELQLLQTITRYLQQGLDGSGWAEERLAAIQSLRRAAEDIVRQLGEDTTGTVAQAVSEAYRTGQGAALTDLPDDAATRLAAQEAAASVITRTGPVESLASALLRDVGERHSNVLRHVLDVYRTVVTQATAVSIAGGRTRREAAQFAFQRFVDQGVVSFTDVRGRQWRLSSYVEMAVRTVTQRAAVQGQTDRLAGLGVDLVIVSNEAQECPRCRPYEGKVLRHTPGPIGSLRLANPATGRPVTVDVKATLDDARADGLQHPNCRHVIRAYLPGVTRLPDRPTADPEGDAARTRQRAIERGIRHWKERETAALDPAAAAASRAKVRAWQGAMREHLDANPQLKRLRYREQIGAGNVPR